ncbi:MAG: isoamylase early set domain-containing protein [Ginsengibacter sp.]
MKKEIVFTLPAEALEGASEAVVLGDFNNWTPGHEFELKRQEDGSFKTTVELEGGKTYQYRFLLNNGTWQNDYHAENYVPVSGLYIDNSVITVPEIAEEDVKQTSETVDKEEAAKPKVAKAKAAKPTAKVEAVKTKKVAPAKTVKAKPAAEKVKAEKTVKPVAKETSKAKK